MGFLKRKGEEDTIIARGYKMGNNYAEALGKTLQSVRVSKLDLSSNRITNVGANAIMEHLTPSLRIFNLANNKIGD